MCCIYTTVYSSAINLDKLTFVGYYDLITDQIHIKVLGSVLIKITKKYLERFRFFGNLCLHTCKDITLMIVLTMKKQYEKIILFLWLLSHLDFEWTLYWKCNYKVTLLVMFLYYLKVTPRTLKNMTLLLTQAGKWKLDHIPA